jgi:hypothetical protein
MVRSEQDRLADRAEPNRRPTGLVAHRLRRGLRVVELRRAGWDAELVHREAILMQYFAIGDQ